MIDIARSISRQMCRQIPDGKEYLTPRELHDWEIPGFVADQVEILMQRKLKESLLFPETEWVNRNKPSIQRSWEAFSNSLMSEVRLPVSRAPHLFDEAVANILKTLLTPRVAIPDLIFGDDHELTSWDLEERTGIVSVFRHLAQAPVRFLERKGFESLTHEQCRHVITRVDEKLASRYNAEDWCELIDPLFQLTGGRVDSDLFRIFFINKGLTSVARSFELLNRPVSKRELSDMLASFDFPMKTETAGVDSPGEKEEPKTLFELFGSTEAGEDEDEEEAAAGVDTDNRPALSLHSGYQDRAVPEKESPDPTPEEDSIESVPEEPDVHEESASPEPGDFVHSDQNSEPPSLYSQFIAEPEPDEISDDESGEEIEEDHTIWKRFVETDRESAVPSAGGHSESADSLNLNSKTEDDTAAQRPDSNQEDQTAKVRDRIESWIGDEKGRFVENLFRGSEKEFREVLTGLAGITDWREAARYIETEVFDRYELDLSNEVAIDFTDTMHSYFLDSKPAQ